jgi:hypothetical protein
MQTNFTASPAPPLAGVKAVPDAYVKSNAADDVVSDP